MQINNENGFGTISISFTLICDIHGLYKSSAQSGTSFFCSRSYTFTATFHLMLTMLIASSKALGYWRHLITLYQIKDGCKRKETVIWLPLSLYLDQNKYFFIHSISTFFSFMHYLDELKEAETNQYLTFLVHQRKRKPIRQNPVILSHLYRWLYKLQTVESPSLIFLCVSFLKYYVQKVSRRIRTL